MAMRTAAPSALSTQGWSGMAKRSASGGSAARWCSSTRRLKVWRRLLVVIRPKRWMAPLRASPAALSHQNMT